MALGWKQLLMIRKWDRQRYVLTSFYIWALKTLCVTWFLSSFSSSFIRDRRWPVAQAGLTLVTILLPQPPEGWNYRREPPHLLEIRTIFPSQNTLPHHFKPFLQKQGWDVFGSRGLWKGAEVGWVGGTLSPRHGMAVALPAAVTVSWRTAEEQAQYPSVVARGGLRGSGGSHETR